MNPNDPIRRVSVVSTGNVQIRPDHVSSTWRPMFWWLLTSRQWTGPRPINAYVIEHRDGVVLFDTGQDRASVTDPDYFPGGWRKCCTTVWPVSRSPQKETLSAGLGRLGYATGDVHTAILSHLHQDHIGGLGELGQADIVVSKIEWDTLSSLRPELRGLMTRHIDLPGLRWNRIAPAPTNDPDLSFFAGSHDLFGDGSLVLLPTPGHTPGSMSLLVRQAGLPPLLMVGDLDLRRAPARGRSRPRCREPTSPAPGHLHGQQAAHADAGSGDPASARPGAADRLARATGESPVTLAS